MTKNDYLQKLADALITDEEGRQAVLRFYEELIEDRMESGMTEDEAVADMEDIDDLAGRLNAEFATISDGENEEKKTGAKTVSRSFELDTNEIGRMGKDALKAVKTLFKGAAAGLNKVANTVGDSFGTPAGGSTAEEAAEETAEEADETAAGAADAVEEIAEDAAAETGNDAEEAGETSGGAEDAAEEAGEEPAFSGDPMDQVRELADKLNEKLNSAAGGAKNFFKQVAEGFSKLVSEAVAKAQEQAENAARQEAEAGQDIPAGAEQSVEDAVKETEDALKNAQEQLQQTADALVNSETVQQVAEEMTAAVENVAGDIRETAGSAGDDEGQTAWGWTSPAGDPFENTTGDDLNYRKMEFTCAAGAVTAAALFPCDFPVKVAPSGDDLIHLTYYTHPKDVYTAEIKDGVLTLTHTGKRRVRATFSFFNSLFSVLKGNSENAFEEIRLLLPAGRNYDLTVRSSNARVTVEELTDLGIVNVRTSNGAVGFRGLKAKDLKAGSSNGRVTAEGVESAGGMSLSSSNGAIRTNNLKCAGKLDMTTSNGAVEMIDIIADTIRADTSNAAIRVDHIAAGSYDLCTGNGAVSGVMPGKQEDYAISSHTSNGKNSLPENSSGAIPFRVRTSNGAISITFAGV